MDKAWSGNSMQVLQDIDRKMSLIEVFLQQIFGDWSKEEIYEIHQIIIEVSHLLLILQQDPKVTSLAKRIKPTTPKYTGTVQSIVS
ncbi:hypothetical protein ACT7C1_32735 [Bacillus paranthracis]